MGDQQLLSLIVPLLLFCSILSVHIQCAEVDFNRTVFTEFRECNQRQLPALVIKNYSANNIPNYRPTSLFFLGTNVNKFSCIESSDKFPLNPDSYIKAPVYFKSISGAFIEILVYDLDQNLPVYSWRKSDGKGDWTMAHIDIKNEIPNAQVRVLQCYINNFLRELLLIGFEYI